MIKPRRIAASSCIAADVAMQSMVGLAMTSRAGLGIRTSCYQPREHAVNDAVLQRESKSRQLQGPWPPEAEGETGSPMHSSGAAWHCAAVLSSVTS